MKNLMRQVYFVSLLGLGLSGCGQYSGDLAHDIAKLFRTENEIVSNRPQNQTQFIAVLKLHEAALFTTAKKDASGKTIVDADLTKSIADEQDAVIKELAALSSEIKVLYRYKRVMNGIAIVAPNALAEKIQALHSIASLNAAGNFERPVIQEEGGATSNTLSERNSVKFIGGDKARAQGITGQNVRIGIIDTGIDYTHGMFGGPGTEEAYKAINPALANSLFPSKKVVGGSDLVGTDFDSAAPDFNRHIPRMDPNPLDEAGHGSHVAGTVAGRGDGVTSYDGVAPDALLYAIKVFGKTGSTNDAVVVAALEYAADPNDDLDFSDQLDVVNLSLGSGFGSAHTMYSEAIQNLVRGGTSVVASAGNSGPVSYIVGSPSIADEALSVAASTDDADQNWRYDAVNFVFSNGESVAAEAIQGPVSKTIAETGDVKGDLVYIGLADRDLTDDQVAKVKGHVALIDRGMVTFFEKLKRAVAAGAIGAVVANNQDGMSISMGGATEPVSIPAVMISKALGTQIKDRLKTDRVSIQFKTSIKIEKPENIDTLTSFSSKGPRSIDGFLKPEISAPGSLVISAAMGKGKASVSMSGTSMAAPHMTGVIALLRQKFPKLSALELKALAMGTSKTIADQKKVVYPITQQGAGRVQIENALNGQVIALDPALSLGEVPIESRKVLRRGWTLKNISDKDLVLKPSWQGNSHVNFKMLDSVSLKAGESVFFKIELTVDARDIKDASAELDGLVKFSNADGVEVLRVPALTVVNKIAQVGVESLKVGSTSINDAEGAAATLTLSNKSNNAATAYAFNSLGGDERKSDPFNNPFVSRACDLEAAGYRVVNKVVADETAEYLQIAVKLYDTLTTWNFCEISVLIDSNGDSLPEQELAGVVGTSLAGITKGDFMSLLLDAPKTRELRKAFEAQVAKGDADAKEDYTSAVLGVSGMKAFEHSSIAIVEVPTQFLSKRPTGELAVKVLTTHQDSSALEYDDYLGRSQTEWKGIDISKGGQSYFDMPESILVPANASVATELTKGSGNEDLLLLFPSNRPVQEGLTLDGQMALPQPTFLDP